MRNILQLIRPHQWIKNLFLFAPLFFAFRFDSGSLIGATCGFVLFCMTASSIYILNDYFDIAEDREHPTKRHRPLASGAISKSSAIVLMLVLSITALSLSFLLEPIFFMILLFYVALNIAYTLRLKHIAILDISIIAIGFVLRIFAGAVLVGVSASMWIVLVTFVLALFLALAKRRDDCLLASEGKKTRKNIDGYNLEMVNASMTLMAGVTVVAYIMYTIDPAVTHRLGSHHIYLSSFFVIIGILRYMQITFVESASGSPTKIVLRDRFLQAVLIGWLASFWILRQL